MPSMWLWLSFRFLVHLVSWTNGVVGTVECAFVWEGGWDGMGWGGGGGVMVDTSGGVTQPSPQMTNIAQHFRDCHSHSDT